jgi:hypothetical protein
MQDLTQHIQNWLMVNRDQVREQVIQSVLATFAAVDSPEPREGIHTGLDFLRVLKNEGGDNGLWHLTMEQLDSEIFNAVSNLSAYEQVSLLLPLCDDIEGLSDDHEPTKWAEVLLKHLDNEWQPILRRAVMQKLG